MRFNRAKWNEERLKLETQIRELKHSIRHGGIREDRVWNQETRKYELKPVSFTSGMGTDRDYTLLGQLKASATAMYKVRAHYRGRVHLKTDTLEEQGALVGEYLKDYLVWALDPDCSDAIHSHLGMSQCSAGCRYLEPGSKFAEARSVALESFRSAASTS